MTAQSLTDLKAENAAKAAAVNAAKTETTETVEEVAEVEPITEPEETTAELNAEPAEGETLTEEPKKEEDGQIPLDVLLGKVEGDEKPPQEKVDYAFQQLKLKKDREIQEGKDRIATLEAAAQANQTATLQQIPGVTERPKLEDYGYDEAAHLKADTEWILNATSARQNIARQEEAQRVVEAETQRKVDQAVSEHNDRVSGFLNRQPDISMDDYDESKVELEALIGRAGHDGGLVYNHLISVIGKGSESILFSLGKHPEAKAEFFKLLSEDRSGSKAMFYVGKLATDHGQYTNKSKQATTSAPDPPPDIAGDVTLVSNSKAEKALRKKYTEAHKNKEPQKAWDVKKEAKEAGFDVGAWR